MGPGPHAEKGSLCLHDGAHRQQFRPSRSGPPPRSNPGSAPEPAVVADLHTNISGSPLPKWTQFFGFDIIFTEKRPYRRLAPHPYPQNGKSRICLCAVRTFYILYHFSTNYPYRSSNVSTLFLPTRLQVGSVIKTDLRFAFSVFNQSIEHVHNAHMQVSAAS